MVYNGYGPTQLDILISASGLFAGNHTKPVKEVNKDRQIHRFKQYEDSLYLQNLALYNIHQGRLHQYNMKYVHII